MEKKILLLCLLICLPIVTPQSKEEILNNITLLLQENANFNYPEYYKDFYNTQFYDGGNYGTFDFIIIGGGSAGTVLANRLSEISNWNILLLEAGQDDTLYTDIPGLGALLQFTDFNWAYRTNPQTTCCLGMENNQCHVPRGKGLGGSSTINIMLYTRGNRADYDKLAEDGNTGWSYDEVLKYFLKSENSSLTDNVDVDFHSKKGSLYVEHIRNFGPLGQAFLDANERLGRKILDYNGKDEMGFSRQQTNTINGRRCSGNKAFLKPVLNRPNLKVQTGAFVTKLHVSSYYNEYRVWGVEFMVGNIIYYAETKKEVILSAGAIGSPQILMHSGIGPKQHLESLGIQTCVDLPVGQNLHDHVLVIYPYSSNFTEQSLKPIDKMADDYSNGDGYLTSAANLQSIGYINTKDNTSSIPDIEHLISASFDLFDGFLKRAFNLQNETYNAFTKPFTKHVVMSLHILLHPKSRGTVTLKSNNCFDHPVVDLNYFSDPDDIEALVDGLNDIFTVMKTPEMQKFNVTIEYNPIPQCTQEFLSRDYLRCLIRYMATTSYHQSGTCKMGPDSDPEAVVCPKLKVKGVRNLRVIDASIFPNTLSAHTNAPTYMVAEKGSDLIKQDWRDYI